SIFTLKTPVDPTGASASSTKRPRSRSWVRQQVGARAPAGPGSSTWSQPSTTSARPATSAAPRKSLGPSAAFAMLGDDCDDGWTGPGPCREDGDGLAGHPLAVLPDWQRR